MRTHQDVLDAVKNLMADKGQLYGKTYLRVATALSVPPQYSILVRIQEKIFRADNLLKQGRPDQAHLREEFLDIAVYAILAAFESESKPKPELKEGSEDGGGKLMM